jgi:endonuclease/exonuclease/phosphatase (EEP) superfamily protein YafD
VPFLARTRLQAIVRALVWIYLAGVVAVAACLLFLGDRHWLGTALLFAPRWIWAVPLPLLALLAAIGERRLLLPLLLALVVLLFPVMGLQVPSPGRLLAGDAPRDLRLMTYNVGGGEIEPAALGALLDEIRPDVALFQECNELVEGARRVLAERGWHVDVQPGSCIASRFPVRAVDARDRTDVYRMNGSGVVVRYEIDVPGLPLNVVNVHLATAREGISSLMSRAPWRGAPTVDENMRLRDHESSLARAWTERATGPLVVTGDFNVPIESRIYQRYWSAFTNAFSAAGAGFGYTKATRWHGIRIDHVLLGQGWRCLDAYVTRHLGGDHRPLVADLRYTGGASLL